ncbi:pentapeptide repeat-containing protein [Nocardia sp. NPDC058666]|uniref:pentapeptide repeat-containing protein n=1 Tax=Nocardia sp. NPDC058666 TaxID=3346587 RepID=UPI003646297B
MRTQRVGIVAAVCLSIILVTVAGWLVLAAPQRLTSGETAGLSAAERLAAIATVRDQMIKFVTAMGALILTGLGLYRYWLDKAKQRLDEDKHLIGWFDSAAGRLAAEEPNGRAAGVRTLFKLMLDSARDHMLALESICDILRRYAVAPADPTQTPIEHSLDVTAAAAALRDRPDRDETPLDLTGVWLRDVDLRGVRLRGAQLGRAEHRTADLAGADLTEADLTAAKWPHAQLARAVLHRARLTSAHLDNADLTGANLTEASCAGIQLPNAVLFTADLTRADLTAANLRGVRFRGAIMESTDLTDADLTAANLAGTDLRTVIGLTESMVRAAIVDSTTALPPNIGHPNLEP